MNNQELLIHALTLFEDLCEGAAYNHYQIDYAKIKDIRALQELIAASLGL